MSSDMVGDLDLFLTFSFFLSFQKEVHLDTFFFQGSEIYVTNLDTLRL